MISIKVLLLIILFFSLIVGLACHYATGSMEIAILGFVFIWLAPTILLSKTFFFDTDAISTEEYIYQDKQIVASLGNTISLENHQKGTFLLGTGTIKTGVKQKAVYNAFVGSTDEKVKTGLKLRSFEMEETELFLDENEQPYTQKRIKKETVHYKENWLNGGLLKPKEDAVYYQHFSAVDELHLPKDTLQIEYNVDLN